MEHMRSPGFYWVRRRWYGVAADRTKWTIAEFYGGQYTSWLVVGTEAEFEDGDFAVIGPKIEEPQ